MAKKTQQVATRKPPGALAAGVPKHLQGYESSGKGVQTSADDVLIPMARVLDAKSPEVLRGNAKQIKGAEAGDIYIKNGPVQIIKGERGFLFQPCLITKGVVEWVPRKKGGGYVALHPSMPKDMVMKPHPEDAKRMVPTSKETGNSYVETRYYGGHVVPEPGTDARPYPLVIAFASSGHSVAKAWNMLTASKMLGGEIADLWLVVYRIKTKSRQKNDNNWFVFDVTDAGDEEDDGLPTTMWVPTEDYVKEGARLAKQMGSGQQKFDAGAASGTDDDDADDGKM